MSSEETPKRKSSLGWILCAAAMVVVFPLGMLAASINERKAEVASIYNNKKIELTQTNAKNGDWGLNYPREYETWKMTEKGDFKSKYNGNDEHDVLADRPNMVILWAGYAFSQDYTKPRGHMHAIEGYAPHSAYRRPHGRQGRNAARHLLDLQEPRCPALHG